MADHIDGPRSIGDPSIDLTDLFVFTSPEDATRTVIAADVFPSAGASAMFSNIVNHSIVIRRVAVAGLGENAAFAAGNDEFRFSFRFNTLVPSMDGGSPIQRGTCTVPGGQVLQLTVNDIKGTSSSDGTFRVFAGLRSDPFYLAWLPDRMRKIPNLLQHDNVLCMVVEFNTGRVFGEGKGSLFGAIAETAPLPHQGAVIGHDPPRFDWIGKPEQTNVRLNNGCLKDVDDVRDLWNQQTPFAISDESKPLFRKRLVTSLTDYASRDTKVNWTPSLIAANAEVFLEDFLLFDVSKPITDTSHLEIEKSTINGRPYETGGGRTIDANCIDILLTWLINRDQGEFLQGGATGATQPGGKTFPYFAPPNAEIQTIAESVVVRALPNKVWGLIGAFGSMWHPLIAELRLTGVGNGQLRTIQTIDGKQIIERLEAIDTTNRTLRYGLIAGIPAINYTGTLSVKPSAQGSLVTWRVQYLADGQPDIIVSTIIKTLVGTGLTSLKARFG
jgi:hypothetical protein